MQPLKQIDIIGKAHIQNNCDYNMVTANIYLNLFYFVNYGKKIAYNKCKYCNVK